MKTATFLSLSVAFVLGGLVVSVGCSSPTVGASSADSADTGDDDDSTAKAAAPAATTAAPAATTPAATTDAGVVTTTTGTPTTTTPAACTTCLGTNAAAAAFVACDASCKDDDCDNACFASSGCTEDTCDTILSTCNAQCFPPPDPATDPCVLCLGASTPAGQYITCWDQQACNGSNRCDDQCFEQACGNDERSCNQALRNCQACQ